MLKFERPSPAQVTSNFDPTAGEAMADCGHLFRLLAAGHLALLAVTWPLWIPQAVFPQIPLISIAGRLPPVVEWGLLVTLVASLGTMLSLGIMKFAGKRGIGRWASLAAGLSTLGLVGIDQHRLQPWAWQFVLLSLVVATADPPTAQVCWRSLVIGIYAWSAWSKMDQSFFVNHGRFLLDGFCKSIGLPHGTEFWPETVRWSVAAAIPMVELLIALGLAWHRTRRSAVIGAVILHGGLLFALGPLGHGHRPGVLVWNVFFLVQNWCLFQCAGPREAARRSRVSIRCGNSFARFIVFAAMFWPALESFGLCDHWPAWAVYAATPERFTVFVHGAELTKVPTNLKQYLGTQPIPDDWFPLRIDRWSLDTLYAPIYPQDRFQVGVTLALVQDLELKRIRIVIEGPANRWTGNRTVQQYIGMESLEELANSYRCGGRPRSKRKKVSETRSSAVAENVTEIRPAR